MIKESYLSKFPGTLRNDLVYLTGIGGDEIKSTSQISSEVNLGHFMKLLTFHVVPDSCLTDPVIIGRDILDNGVSVKINNDNLMFYFEEQVQVCKSIATQPDLTRIDTDLTARDRDALIRLLNKYASNFVDGIPRRRVNTGELEIDLVDPHKTVQRRPYRLAPIEKQTFREKVQELLDAGVIRESTSPFASSIPLVKKRITPKECVSITGKPLIYMDNVLCCSGDISECFKRLDEVSSALCTAGFSLNLKKSQFMKKKIVFLGYSIQCEQVVDKLT